MTDGDGLCPNSTYLFLCVDLVALEHRIAAPRGLAIGERQDLVDRDLASPNGNNDRRRSPGVSR